MSYIQNNSIFWIEVDKVKPNPFQPRRDFNPEKLKDLSDSIKMYGLLQPLTVTRHEEEKEDGGLVTSYELIAGERRLRASKLAGLVQVPVIIRSGDESDQVKLELAIIENLQRDDLNPIERAMAFQQLVDQFGFKHGEVAKKVGKSREYVSNTIRLMSLPDEVKQALAEGKLSEGHARPILMLKDRPEEQLTLFKEVVFKKLTVREAEAISRRIAYDKVRKQSRSYDPELVEMEDKLAESLGTRVFIEKKPVGGKITIDYFSNGDLRKILELLQKEKTNLTTIGEIEKLSQENSAEANPATEFVKEVADILGDDSGNEEGLAMGEGLEDDSLGDNDDSEEGLKTEEGVEEEVSTPPPTTPNFSIPNYAEESEDDSPELPKRDEDSNKGYSFSDFTI